jgi:hypothetical protein
MVVRLGLEAVHVHVSGGRGQLYNSTFKAVVNSGQETLLHLAPQPRCGSQAVGEVEHVLFFFACHRQFAEQLALEDDVAGAS